MKRHSLSALVAAGLLAGGLSTTSASAADLGGNCCADLEERVAELEATVARKGNRKVSLTISGWVGEQVMWWDSGDESNTYVTGLGTTLSSHFKFSGEAQIRQGLTAGYLLHVEVGTPDPLAGVDQTTDEGLQTVRAFQSYWYLKDDRLGKLSVGLLSPASDNAALLTDGSGSLVPANWVLFDNQNFFLSRNGVRQPHARWGGVVACQAANGGGVAGDCGGFAGPGNYVRYDSPTFAGFSVSADWGEDDAWDVAARYAGEMGGFKLAAAASYFEQNDTSNVTGGPARSYWQVGGYIQHVATGLFLHAAYGQDDTDAVGVVTGDTWYAKAGLRQKWTPLGHTVLYGEYGNKNDMFSAGAAAAGTTPSSGLGGTVGVTGSDMTQWGLGIVQEIDAAAMSIWLAYRNFDAEITCTAINGACGAIGKNDFDQMHIVKFGALISF